MCAHPFIPAPNTALIEMVYSWGTQIVENTFHVQGSAPFTSSDLQALTQNVFDLWDSTGGSSWHNQRSTLCMLNQIKGRALDTASSPVYIYTLVAPRGGIIGPGTSLPGNVTFCVTLQTGLAGRSFRGRIYAPGISSAVLQSAPNYDLISAAQANAYVASINALIAQIPAFNSAWHLVVTSYYHAGAWRATAVNTRVINAAYADLALDSQRRRLVGRGH
jgi:hypothetical protein